MKVCVYSHPCKVDLIIFRLEKYPLHDYCERLSFFYNIIEERYKEIISSITNTLNPEDNFELYGRTFIIFQKDKKILILKKILKIINSDVIIPKFAEKHLDKINYEFNKNSLLAINH